MRLAALGCCWAVLCTPGESRAAPESRTAAQQRPGCGPRGGGPPAPAGDKGSGPKARGAARATGNFLDPSIQRLTSKSSVPEEVTYVMASTHKSHPLTVTDGPRAWCDAPARPRRRARASRGTAAVSPARGAATRCVVRRRRARDVRISDAGCDARRRRAPERGVSKHVIPGCRRATWAPAAAAEQTRARPPRRYWSPRGQDASVRAHREPRQRVRHRVDCPCSSPRACSEGRGVSD